jgi:hypothetical protein
VGNGKVNIAHLPVGGFVRFGDIGGSERPSKEGQADPIFPVPDQMAGQMRAFDNQNKMLGSVHAPGQA